MTCRWLIALTFFGPIVASLPPTHRLQRFTADLDATPEQQWGPIWETFLDEHGTGAFEETYSAWLEGLAFLLPEQYNGSSRALESGEQLLTALKKGHPRAYAELAALSKALLKRKNAHAFQLPLMASAVASYVLQLSSLKNTTDTRPHELTSGKKHEASACTSTLVIGDDRSVLHGRSLDYEPRDPVAATTIQVDFTRDGVVEYSCMHPLTWTTALQWFTCIRPQRFSLSVNARGQGVSTEHNTTFAEMLSRIENPGALLLGEMGEAAMKASDYLEAVNVLSSSKVISSNYFIVADGAAVDGAIITRYGNRSLYADVWRLGTDVDQAPWMRVQTNVDHNVTMKSGAYATHRRQHMIDLLHNGTERASIPKEEFWKAYFTDSALDLESMVRQTPEDTGVILRPTTIATAIMTPAAATAADAFPAKVWATSPQIHPPRHLTYIV
eukprot:TRINITY_DN101095_c0_g1_i1.p1 TRINITY_DN101095_c0_g1~~TRINITY_DN101095_c0_g1_i1.p1  ORF type:complete len:442 (+),score=87.35 TRINITY_DN101095_c0_g1_i1:80-1405(+)